jgi:hypothetical protein
MLPTSVVPRAKMSVTSLQTGFCMPNMSVPDLAT